MKKEFLTQKGLPDVKYSFKISENRINVRYKKAESLIYPDDFIEDSWYLRIDGSYGIVRRMYLESE